MDNPIKELAENELFVFGSNLAGHHLGGAAYQAAQKFGAVNGVGEGLTGQCYAFPTLDSNFNKLSGDQLKSAVEALYRCASAHPDVSFLLTKVGTGIAGFSEEYMKGLFSNTPANIIKPKDWQD